MKQHQFNRFNFLATLGALVFCLGSAQAQAQMTSTGRGNTDFTGFTSHFSVPVGVGLRHNAIVGGAAMNTLHAEAEIKNDLWTGLGFGFDNGFDQALINGTLRYNLDNKVNYAFFGEFDAGWLRAAGNNGFVGGALVGFEYSLSRQFRMTWAYGIQYAFGSAVAEHLGITNNSFVGNFGIHYYL